MQLCDLLLLTPAVETWKVFADPLVLEGPCVAQVVSGRLRAASDPAAGPCEAARLEPDDVLCVPPDRRVSLRATFGAELCGVRAEGTWKDQVAAVADSAVGSELPFFVERGGTDTASRMRRLLREQGEALASGCASDRLWAAARSLELLATALEVRRAVVGPTARRCDSAGRAAFRSALDELTRAPLDDVSLVSFARRVGLSERQVSRLFREELGKTFSAHMAELRLERARRLLRETDQSILDVAGETGWRSLAHFNAVFRRRVGLTPRAFRDQSRWRGTSG